MNLIMDILAAISLGTEPITEKPNISPINKETRISRAAKIFTPGMWRNIVVQAAYQIVIVLCLMYFGTFMFFDESYNLVTTPLRKDDKPTSKMKMDTMIFTTYFLMNMFNQINCRVVDDKEINVFATLFNNAIFWVVLAAELAVTHLMLGLGHTNFGTAVLGVTTLSPVQYILCWVLAALTLPLFILSKSISMQPFQKLMMNFDLEREVEGQVAAFEKAKQMLKNSTARLEDESPVPRVGPEEEHPEDEGAYREDWQNGETAGM